MPPAAVLICAASLHGAYRGCEEQQQSFSDVLNALKPETEAKHQQVLVSLLFLCMKDYLSALLYPQVTPADHVHIRQISLSPSPIYLVMRCLLFAWTSILNVDCWLKSGDEDKEE
ncbi:hypothetical protein CHARACLAT_031715 [Characodon lateralis]|uniref:Uncharacterized protein n=1 Tax=Characodon lateralis TaxID=208331 RepID=A0ABU7DLI4_9TELE|nr:hypothetical protein [Characodon lateralis]